MGGLIMKNYFVRYSWFIFGVLLSSLGIALTTKAAMGTTPISSVPYVLSFRFPLSFGQITFLINLLFILGQALLLRKISVRSSFFRLESILSSVPASTWGCSFFPGFIRQILRYNCSPCLPDARSYPWASASKSPLMF